ncbi:hypothetical protein [Shimia sp.]|uniref:hypothetical protein n=1 Tax=Shimia sp. TaxID=1954381 RepID=UPI0032968A6F
MQHQFQTPKGTRILVLLMLALVALDFSWAIEPAQKLPLRMAIGLCGIGAVTWFLMAFIRFRL